MKLEIFRGSADYEGTASMAGIGTLAAGQWEEIQATSPDVLTGGTRGVFWGTMSPNPSAEQKQIDYINLATTGNSQDFGDSTIEAGMRAACGSRTRGLCAGAYNSHPTADTIDFITYSSTGDATDFGNLVGQYYSAAGLSNSTRGVWMGGTTNATSVSGSDNTIQYVTIASTGGAVDFGDLTKKKSTSASFNSQTRGIIAGGYSVPSNARVNEIEYIETSTLGNGADFGDLSTTSGFNSSMQGCNSVRAVVALGNLTASGTQCVNTVEYITMATLGNSADFGDVSTASEFYTAASSPTRCVWHINAAQGGNGDKLEYVQIMTTGNGIDFGDCTERYRTAGCSNGHGGL
jgi:hypothetical protein